MSDDIYGNVDPESDHGKFLKAFDDYNKAQGPSKCEFCCKIRNDMGKGGHDCVEKCHAGDYDTYNVGACFLCYECVYDKMGIPENEIDNENYNAQCYHNKETVTHCNSIVKDEYGCDLCSKGAREGCCVRGPWREDIAETTVTECLKVEDCIKGCIAKARETGDWRCGEDVSDENCMTQGFLGIDHLLNYNEHKNCMHKCMEDGKAVDGSVFNICKCRGGIKEGDALAGIMMGGLIITGALTSAYLLVFNDLGRAAGLADLPLAVIEVMVDMRLADLSHAQDNERIDHDLRMWKRIRKTRTYHQNTLDSLRGENLESQQEVFELMAKFDTLEKQSKTVNESVRSVLKDAKKFNQASVIYNQRTKNIEDEEIISQIIVIISLIVLVVLSIRFVRN